MGAIQWRAQEWVHLKSLVNSDEGKQLLKAAGRMKGENAARSMWFRNAANWFVKEYNEKFAGQPFDEETDLELAFRQNLQPRAKLTRLGAESEDDRLQREEKVGSVSVSSFNIELCVLTFP